MKASRVIAAVTLAVVVVLAFLEPWVSVALGLLTLGVAGYLPSIVTLKLSRRTSLTLLSLFIAFSLGQMALHYRQEKDARRTDKLLVAALTDTQAFPFCIVVEPDRTPHFVVNVSAPVFRPFFSSRGPGLYARFMQLGGGDTVQLVPERPNIAPLSTTYVINNPPVEPLTPPFKFMSVDELVIDVAEMAMIHWLLTVGASTAEIEADSASAIRSGPTIRNIHNAFSHNRFIGYLADTAEHRRTTKSFLSYPMSSASHRKLSSETSSRNADVMRLILVVEPSYRMRISIRHSGQTRLKPQQVDDLGIPLKYNDVSLPFVMTEDFEITVTVMRDEGSLMADMSAHEIVSLMRRDFDWIVYKDTLLLTSGK